MSLGGAGGFSGKAARARTEAGQKSLAFEQQLDAQANYDSIARSLAFRRRLRRRIFGWIGHLFGRLRHRGS